MLMENGSGRDAWRTNRVGVEREVGVLEGVEWCGANKKGGKGESESVRRREKERKKERER